MIWEQINSSSDRLKRGSALMQGDVLRDTPVPHFGSQYGDGSPRAQWIPMRLIVLTQSCDLVSRESQANEVFLCRIVEAVDMLAKDGKWSQTAKGRFKNIRAGRQPEFHLLHDWEDPNDPKKAKIADFRQVFSVPLDYLKNHAASLGTRPRIHSPYREHFSQAYARYHMRVGLPSDLPDIA